MDSTKIVSSHLFLYYTERTAQFQPYILIWYRVDISIPDIYSYMTRSGHLSSSHIFLYCTERTPQFQPYILILCGEDISVPAIYCYIVRRGQLSSSHIIILILYGADSSVPAIYSYIVRSGQLSSNRLAQTVFCGRVRSSKCLLWKQSGPCKASLSALRKTGASRSTHTRLTNRYPSDRHARHLALWGQC